MNLPGFDRPPPTPERIRELASQGGRVERPAWQVRAKRVVDLVGGAILLGLASPVLALTALAVLVVDGRPVIFSQERVGHDGRSFRAFKFRAMVHDAEERLPEVVPLNPITGPALQLLDDPRVTRLGRILRRYSLDELPQLLNVLRGEMSLVGPRPAPMFEVRQYEPWHYRRLAAKPGLTGLAQVEIRAYDDFDDRARLDIRYVETWSLRGDLAILARTIPVVLRGTGR